MVFLLLVFILHSADAQLQLKFGGHEGNSFYSIWVNNELWLDSGQIEAYFGHQWFTANSTLSKQSNKWNAMSMMGPSKSTGSDNFGGIYDIYTYQWKTSGSTSYTFNTSIKIYNDGEAISFVQSFSSSIDGTNFINMSQVPSNCGAVQNVIPFLSWPSFNVHNKSSKYVESQLGFINWRGTFSNGRTDTTPLSSDELSGVFGGPVVLFDNNNNALIVSPNDHFPSSTMSNMGYDNRTDWKLGIAASILTVPASFQHETVFVFSSNGINDVILNKWSSKLLALYPTERVSGDDDVLTSYLGYWTDNGAYYYAYNFRENLDCCDTEVFKQVKAENFDKNGIKIHYWQMDDWWMPVSGLGCQTKSGEKQWNGVGALKSWYPDQPYFAGGLSQLSYDLNVPLALYGPYFSPDNIWANQFNWIPQGWCYVLPSPEDSYSFYSTLFDFGINQSTYKQDPKANTGMLMYEVDFMDCLSMTPEFRLNIGAQQQWLNGMNKAAKERNIVIQYCMSIPSNLLSSLTLSQVTNGRASWDYASAPNWNIGQGALLWSALKLKPSKDNFWTTFPQPGPPNVTFSPYGNDQSSCETMAIIAILSCGPVGFSDSIGMTNATIINRTIRADGRLLQPYSTITAMDDQMIYNVFNHSNINIWSTISGAYINGESENISPIYQIVMAINMGHNYMLNANSFSPPLSTKNQYMIRKFYNYTNCRNQTDAIKSNCVQIVDYNNMYTFTPHKPVKPSNESFELITVMPIKDPNEIVFIGELNKYVSCSQYRFSSLAIQESTSLSVNIVGDVNEIVQVSLLKPTQKNEYTFYTYNVNLGSSGKVVWSIKY